MQIPEISLYVAVINQAFKDGLGIAGDPSYNHQTKINALAWINKDNKDFQAICDIMDIEPSALVRLFHKFKVKKKLFRERFYISRTY